MNRFAILVTLGLVLPAAAQAQVLNPASLRPGDDVVHASFGLDGPARVEAGYARDLASSVPVPLILATKLSIPMRPDGSDFEVDAMAQTFFTTESGWGVSPRLELALRNESASLARLTDFGFHVGGTAGWFRPSVFAALELTFEKSLALWVRPTDRYREAYPEAQSGFYGSGGGFFRLGLATGVAVFGHTEVTLRAGIIRSERLGGVDLAPLYAQLGVNQAF